jgi:hypothetical protein
LVDLEGMTVPEVAALLAPGGQQGLRVHVQSADRVDSLKKPRMQ